MGNRISEETRPIIGQISISRENMRFLLHSNVLNMHTYVAFVKLGENGASQLFSRTPKAQLSTKQSLCGVFCAFTQVKLNCFITIGLSPTLNFQA